MINPTSNKEIELKKSDRIMNTIMLFLITFLSNFIVAMCTEFILSFFEINTDNVRLSKATELYSSLELLLISSLILPLLEEVGFRLFLRCKPIYLALSISVLTYYLITNSIFHTHNTDLENSFETRLLIALIVGTIVYFMSNKNLKKVSAFWVNNFHWILYFSILIFGFVHILNYELSLNVILLTPLIVLPQLFSGVIYSYIRVKYGFIYNFSIHALNNFIAITISILIR